LLHTNTHLVIYKSYFLFILHPESGKELKNMSLTDVSAWKRGKFYQSGIFFA